MIRTKQHGFIQCGDIIMNLMLVKETIEYCKHADIEAYIIIMDF